MTTPIRRTALLGAALALAVAACSSGTEETTTTVAEGPATVEVTAVDYGYAGLPDTVAAGTKLSFTNSSEGEVHELVAIRLPDDEERPVGELVKLPPEELAAFFPGVTTVLIAPPGEVGIPVEGDGVLSEPGRYAIICVIPTGADPAEYMAAAAEAEGGPPDVAGGPPHIVSGMYAEVTVSG